MNYYDKSVEINHNPNWSDIPDYAYSVWIIGDSGSGKTNVLLNLIKPQAEIDKSNLYIKLSFDVFWNISFISRKLLNQI